MEKKTYYLVDVFRYVFACLIPFLHIPFPQSPALLAFREHICRLGVPFFFAVSGYFLAKSIAENGVAKAFVRYFKRIGTVLLFWLLIYSPFIIMSATPLVVVQWILFKTPCYLWYLMAILVGSVLLCHIKPGYPKYIFAAAVYILGTLISDSYSLLTGGCEMYEAIFLTPRNGIFFAFPIMCVGEIVHMSGERLKRRTVLIGFAVSYILLFAETRFVIANTPIAADRTMYILLPVVAYFLLSSVLKFEIRTCPAFFRGGSSAIYVMQYGLITLSTVAVRTIGIESGWISSLLIYLSVIIFGTISYLIASKNKLLRKIF